jgi:hypothetical protein
MRMPGGVRPSTVFSSQATDVGLASTPLECFCFIERWVKTMLRPAPVHGQVQAGECPLAEAWHDATAGQG